MGRWAGRRQPRQQRLRFFRFLLYIWNQSSHPCGGAMVIQRADHAVHPLLVQVQHAQPVRTVGVLRVVAIHFLFLLCLQLGILTVQPLVESLPRKNEGLERRTVQPISATMPMPFNSLNAGTKPTRRRCQQTCWRQTVQGALHVCSNQPTAIVLPFFLTH